MRIWQQEQELYFLQHTSASKYIEVRDFQKNHGAKIIQRKWRSIHPTKKTKDDQTNFDPFIFQPDFSILQKEQQQQQQQDKEPTNRFYGTLPTSVNILPTSLQDMETYRSRRKFLEER
jgi:hypothetical protein